MHGNKLHLPLTNNEELCFNLWRYLSVFWSISTSLVSRERSDGLYIYLQAVSSVCVGILLPPCTANFTDAGGIVSRNIWKLLYRCLHGSKKIWDFLYSLRSVLIILLLCWNRYRFSEKKERENKYESSWLRSEVVASRNEQSL